MPDVSRKPHTMHMVQRYTQPGFIAAVPSQNAKGTPHYQAAPHLIVPIVPPTYAFNQPKLARLKLHRPVFE